MTIGISKKRLREWRHIAVQKGIDGIQSIEMIDHLIAECEEFDPWFPISHHTPKNRRLLLLTKEYGEVVGRWFELSDKGWWAANCMPVTPTHYKELPEDPV